MSFSLARILGAVQLETREFLTPIIIRVIGIPGAQGSKRLTRYGSLIESSKKVQPWRQDIRHASLEAYEYEPIDGPCHVEIDFLFPRPKSHFGTGKNSGRIKPSAPHFLTSHAVGDIDKLCRSTLDGLAVTTGGTVLKDDSFVVSLTAVKKYVERNEYPGAIIHILPYSLTF